MTELAVDELLSVRGLRTVFSGGIRAVDGVDLTVRRARTLAIVGESGSGKSVTSLSIMGLLPERTARIEAGSIEYRGRDGTRIDLTKAAKAKLRGIRGRDLAMIFQEPMTSLNPLFTVGDQIGEALILHEKVGRAEARRRAVALLKRVEIPAAERRIDDYPHQMSGGMRQRVMIALALSCSPALLIADEPTTALDVTIQAQILDLMRKLQADTGMSMLFITHNLGVVAEIAHDVAVMYAGRVVEQADVRTLFQAPKHPYTRALLASTPTIERPRRTGGTRRLNAIEGMTPNPLALPPGCAFAPRCGHHQPACDVTMPALVPVGTRHLSRCRRAGELWP